MQLVAGVELGGTKTIAVLARGQEILEQAVWPTLAPEETLGTAAEQLEKWQAAHDFSALGIASFGPIQLNNSATNYGCILATPKPLWSGAPVVGTLARNLSCPVRIDTDVNGAALAEYRWGAGQGTSSLCYITIGTGLGGGVVVEGRPIHGAMHPEIGHLHFRRAPGDEFSGACPFHGDCIEGLISGPALAKRFGADAGSVSEDDPRWHDVACDVAELAGAILLTVSAERVLVGGGVGMGRPFLLEMAREMLIARLGSYLPFLDSSSARDILRPPALGDLAGPLGAVALALTALEEQG